MLDHINKTSSDYKGQLNIEKISNEAKWHKVCYRLGCKQDSAASVEAYFNAPDDAHGWFVSFVMWYIKLWGDL